MFCTNCGKEIENGAKFCSFCGTSFTVEQSEQLNDDENFATESINKVSNFFAQKKGSAIKENELLVKAQPVKLEEYLIDSSENIITTLGNGFLTNLMFKKVKSCSLILTDKRVYLKGKMYTANPGLKNIKATNEEKILDVKDITGTGFIYTRISMFKFVLWILFILCELAATIVLTGELNNSPIWLINIVTIPGYMLWYWKIMKSRTCEFFIEYAGGRVQINAKLIGISHIRDFHKMLRRAKDSMEK